MSKLINSHAVYYKSVSLKMSITVCFIGVLVLYGWLFDITLLKSILPNYVPMNPNTAVIFILSSISLLLQRLPYSEKQSTQVIMGKLLGIIIILFGFLILLENISDYRFLINQLFIEEKSSINIIFSPVIAAPVTVINFFLIGLSLLLLDFKFTMYFNQILAAIIGLIGLLILTGFTFNFVYSSVFINYLHASLHTAICFILISLSLLFMRPYDGIMTLFISGTNGGTVARRLIPIMILLPLILGYLKTLGEHFKIYDIRTGMASYSILITAILIIVTIFISKMLMKTEIKRARVEKQLRHSNREIEDLYNNAPCGYYSLNQNGGFIHINTTALNWLGYTHAEVVGEMNIEDVLAPASRRIFHQNFHILKKRGTIQDFECEFIRKNDSIFTVLLNATAVKDSNGNFLRSRSTIFDISDRKRIEQALRVSEERFHNAMDTAPIGMAIVGLDGKYIEVNQALCHLVGYSKDELEKMTSQQITSPDDLAIDLANSQKLIEGKIRSLQIEKRYIRKDSAIIWTQLTASILRESTTDKPLYFITEVEDITERKRIEDKIRQLAYHDSLTNLPNRRLLLDRLSNAIALAKRHQRILALLFLDLDKFKIVNDTLGHDVGDELLKAIGVRLNAELRGEDTVARISGDEFVIILNEIPSMGHVGVVANKITERMKSRFLILGHELHIGCSIGISIYPNDGSEISDLMKKADLAMYAAKKNGRNQYQFYRE